MKKFTTMLACACIFPTAAHSQVDETYGHNSGQEGLQISIAAGAVYTPKYLGDDEYQLSTLPNVTVQYDDVVTASIQGIEVNAVNSSGFNFGPVMRFNFGRDEDGSNPIGLFDKTNDLIGLGDVGFTVELGGFAEYSIGKFSARAELRQGVNGHEGLTGEAELKYNETFPVFGRTGFLSIGPELTFGDNEFNGAFFDVNALQSVASGLREFDAGGGLNSYGLHASIVIPINDGLSLIGFGGYDRLTGSIARSSLVQERGSENQVTGGLMLSYSF